MGRVTSPADGTALSTGLEAVPGELARLGPGTAAWSRQGRAPPGQAQLEKGVSAPHPSPQC